MRQNCIIWGAGDYGMKLEKMLSKESEYQVIAFCDRNTELDGKTIGQYGIISVEKAIEMCCQDPQLAVVIGIFNYDIIEEVKRTALKCFPQHTKIITGHSIQDAIENRMLQGYHDHMVFRWEVDLERYFPEWLDNIMSEVEYWVKEVANIQGKNHGYNVRSRENERFSHAGIAKIVKPDDIVLDIGCGLVSKFGNCLDDGNRVRLIPVDALAHFYNQINSRIHDGLKEDYRCYFGMFEFLNHIFGQNFADYIIIDNALDHCIDPWRSLVECLYVLKRDGHMFLNHRRAEAVYEGWTGLHKWNIDCADGELLIWNRQNAVNVTDSLKNIAEVSVRFDEQISSREFQNINVEIVKKKDFELGEFLEITRESAVLTKCIDKLMEKLAQESQQFFAMLAQVQL